MAGIALSMALLLAIANVVAIQYARGAMRLAADEGAAHGSALGNDAASCEQRATERLHGPNGVLRGSLGSGVAVACVVDGRGEMVATVSGQIAWWLPGPDSLLVQVASNSVQELEP